MTLTDHLAHQRTVLANERTLLAYLRTGLALLAAGGTGIRFLGENRVLHATGVVLLILGSGGLVVGVWRFIAVARELRRVYREPPDRSRPGAGRDRSA